MTEPRADLLSDEAFLNAAKLFNVEEMIDIAMAERAARIAAEAKLSAAMSRIEAMSEQAEADEINLDAARGKLAAVEAERDEAKAEALRIHHEKVDHFEARIAAEAGVVRLRAAADVVLRGLDARIDEAVALGVPAPVFTGIADLHDALSTLEPTP